MASFDVIVTMVMTVKRIHPGKQNELTLRLILVCANTRILTHTHPFSKQTENCSP